MRIANGVAPLRLEDGRAAVAWTDNLSDSRFLDLPRGGGRRHVAIAGAPAPAAVVPPEIRVTVPGGQRLYEDEPLRATVRCAAACDLRAVAPPGPGDRGGSAETRSCAKPGRARLRLQPGAFGDLPPWASGRVTVRRARERTRGDDRRRRPVGRCAYTLDRSPRSRHPTACSRAVAAGGSW